jgi:putative membrane protein
MEPAEPLKSSPRVVEMGTAGKPQNPHLSDHLANERTYLAYLRTSIALIGFGVTINRFSIYLVQSKTLPERALHRWNLAGVSRVGFGMVIAGLILLAWAAIHFTQVSRGIERGTYRPSTLIPWIITLAVLFGGGLSLIWLFPD